MGCTKSLIRVASQVTAALGATVLMTGMIAGSASGSTVSSAMVPVGQGISAAAIAGAHAIGNTSSSTVISVSIILEARNLAQLEANVSSGWPGAYLSVPEFAATYGQTAAVVDQLENYLSKFGITYHVMPDMLDVTTRGTVADYNRALGVTLKNFEVKRSSATLQPGTRTTSTQVVYGTSTPPQVPAFIAEYIVAILGLQSYAPFVSQSLKALGPKSISASPAQTIPPGMLTPGDFMQHYNLTPLTQAGYDGSNQTIGIVTLASLNPTVPYTFWNSYLKIHVLPNRIKLENVDGGAGPVSLKAGSDETTLDVEQSGAIAPNAKIIVYQAPNTDYGFVDAFFRAASDNLAGSISASWGESETAIQYAISSGTESPAYATAFNEAYLESAAQGQSDFVSSADYGAYSAASDLGTTNLSVDNPADNAYVTAAGGTTLPGTQTLPIQSAAGTTLGTESVTIPSEMTWNWGYMWPLYSALGYASEADAASSLPLGSGGGYSVDVTQPSYQQNIVGSSYNDRQYLTPSGYSPFGTLSLPTTWIFSPNAALSNASSPNGRAIPDLSVNADPQTGYAVYDPQFTTAYGSPVVQFGGTSFSAPQLNGATADINSFVGHHVGFWNPQIYKFASGTSGTSPFTPLDDTTSYGSNYYSSSGTGTIPSDANYSNDNLYYASTPGAIYNPGSGLGIPNLAVLANSFVNQSAP